MGKIILGIVLFLCTVSGISFYFIFYKSPATPKEVAPSLVAKTTLKETADRAAIAIFINGKKISLTSREFVNRSKDVYFISTIPDIIIIDNLDSTWDTLFKTLPISLNKQCLIIQSGVTYCNGASGTLKFYVNGEKQDNFLSAKILDGDRALVSFGQENQEQINLQMQMVANPLP